MHHQTLSALLALCLSLGTQVWAQQFISADWDTTGLQQQQHQVLQAYTGQRQPISSDIQNQMNALSSQIAAASRQLESLQQQLALVDQQQQKAQYSAPSSSQQPAPTTLVEPNEQLDLPRPSARMFYPARRLSSQQQPLAAPQLEQPANGPQAATTSETPAQQELPPTPDYLTAAVGPHKPVQRNDDKFAIGLGVLSPGYTQKFGNTALDFNQDKNGFSFTLSNNGHSNQPQQVKPAAAATR